MHRSHRQFHPASHFNSRVTALETGFVRTPLHHQNHVYRLALQTPFKKPSRCVNLFRESSLSPMARTNPQRAYVWFSLESLFSKGVVEILGESLTRCSVRWHRLKSNVSEKCICGV